MAENPVKDKAAITGVGYTKISRNSGVSVLVLALEACSKAIKDAGLKPSDIDGIMMYHLADSVSVDEVAGALGIKNYLWRNNIEGGGSQTCAIVGQAAMVIASGLCNHIVIYRAMNGRSGVRMGRLGTGPQAPGRAPTRLFGGAGQWSAPYGMAGPPMGSAMMARRHMALYGTTQDHLGMVAVTERANALKNERAIMRTPLTLEDYHNSRWVAEPFHIMDCCQETDASCALVVSRADLARSMPHRPSYIMSFAYGKGEAGPGDTYDNYTTTYPHYIGPGLFARAGITVKDVKIAELYDAFTICVITQLEDYGFCAKGEGGPFVAEGNIRPTGRIPVGTHGGLLSEGYMHGINNIAEAVSQIRGEAGERQIANADIALCSGNPAGFGSALLMRR